MKKLLYAGLLNNKTSIGEACRRNISCIESTDQVDALDLTGLVPNPDTYKFYRSGITDKLNHQIKVFHLTFHLYRRLLEVLGSPKTKSSTKIGYFVWESSKLRSSDIPVLKDFDQIWTASTYCKDIFSTYIPSDRIKVIPHPIVTGGVSKKYDKFTILLFGTPSSSLDRKNISNTLDLITKVLNGKDYQVILKSQIFNNSELNILKIVIQDHPNIILVSKSLEDYEINKLVSKSHLLISLHRSEGFGLTLAEAMSSKTLTLATGYSGNLEFQNNSNSLLVSSKLIPVSGSYFEGYWADPNMREAGNKLEDVFHNYSKYYDIIEKAYEDIKSISYPEVSKIISEVRNQIL